MNSEVTWQVVNKGDVRCRQLADKHYTRKAVGHPMWTRPGYNYVLYAQDERGGAVYCWWRPKWEAGQERKDGLRCLECTIFRNETAAKSSALILEAIYYLRRPEARKALNHPVPEAFMLLTGVDSRKTSSRRSRHSLPGECFRRAGFKDFPHKKGRADVWLALEP